MKKMLLFVFLMITSIGWGQQIEPYKFTSVVDLYEFPTIGTTGMVDVDLPLYTINTKGFELPLTLRYDQMGNTNVFYKGNQFGDAWVLNALGTISRETKVQSVSTPATSLLIICGDQKVIGSAPAFRILESPKVPDEIYYLSNPTVRYRDTNKADVFTFSILGLSGKFRLYNDSGALKAEILESTDFVNIQIVTPAVGENIGSIILRDKNGFRYEFSTPSNINNNYYTHTTYLDTTLTLEDSCYLTSGNPSETPAIAPVGGSTILFYGTLISREILNDHAKFWENLEITKIYDKADNLLLEFEYDLVQFFRA